MMKRKKARKWYYSVAKNGSRAERKDFFDNLGRMEYGLFGEIARDMVDEYNTDFLAGIDIGIMIALDRVFKFK